MFKTFIYRQLQGNPNSSGLQFEVAYWSALEVGGAAQLADAIDRPTYAPASRTMGFTASPRNVLWQKLIILAVRNIRMQYLK